MSEPVINTMLKTHMKYMGDRQKVLAQNIANIDTPAYRARDIKKPDFSKMAAQSIGKLEMRVTNEKHLSGTSSKGTQFATADDKNTFESSPLQNNVVLEDQMAKISDTGAEYQVSTNLLKKYTQLYRKAAGSNQ